MEALKLGDALNPREWAAMRVLAAAVALREIRISGHGTPQAWLAAHDALLHATDSFVSTLEAGSCRV